MTGANSCCDVDAQEAMAGGVFSKLTDTHLYTGAHRERFAEDGHGLGLAGRETISKGGGAWR